MNEGGRVILPEWAKQTSFVSSVTLDVAFLISPTFYFGPENGFSKGQFETLRSPLYEPKLQTQNGRILSKAAAENAEELVFYYQDVCRAIERHGRQPERCRPYFWIRPILFGDFSPPMTFPWYDTIEETESFLQQLANPQEGEIFNDIDQGWQLTFFAEHARLYIQETDDTGAEIYLQINTPAEPLRAQIEPVRERTNKILDQLRRSLSHDFWSRKSRGG